MNCKNDCLQYHSPAHNFNEALPIGNGTLGGMIYGGYPNERISLNLDTLWSGVPHRYIKKDAYRVWRDAVNQLSCGEIEMCEQSIEHGFTGPFTDAYLPLGKLEIHFPDGMLNQRPTENYRRGLNLSRGIAYAGAVGWNAEYLASFSNQCIAVSYTFTDQMNFQISFDSELRGEYGEREACLIFRGQCPVKLEDGKRPVYNGKGIRFAAAVGVRTDGDVLLTQNALSVSGAGYCEIFFSAESSFRSYQDISGTDYEEKSLSRVLSAKKKGFDAIAEQQRRYFGTWFGRVRMNLGESPESDDLFVRLNSEQKRNDLVELLFHYGRYLTISASTPGSQATNLQGIWNEKLYAVWKSNYTVNINTEMNYWPTLMCGLHPFFKPMVDLVEKISDTGSTTAKQFYHANGFVCHHNIDLWGNTVPVGGSGDQFVPKNSNFSFFSGASGWLCRNLFDYYEYTLDEDYLRSTAYPLMKSAADFYLDILREVDGRMAISPATSPENQYLTATGIHAVGKWTTVMQSIILDLFQNCVRCCEVLNTDTEWKNRLLEVIPKLKPFALKKDGALLEWDAEYLERDPKHRHVSHLYGLYPAELITTERTPELAEACKKVLENRGDEGTGWSLAWKACLWAKLKDGNHALKLIKRQLLLIDSEHTSCELWGGGTYPNLLCAHPPFQIDGNFGITAAIAMLFLQCEDDKIKLLPALPDEMPCGEISGLFAKGGICLSFAWKDRLISEVTLETDIPQTALLECNGKTVSVALEKGEKKSLSFENNGQGR